MKDLRDMTAAEKTEYLRRNPIFWSRLGWGYKPPVVENGKVALYNDIGENAERHKKLYEAGIKVHSSHLPLGWVGVDKYNYKTTDEVLEAFFKAVPDGYYLPRISLDVPLEWCKAYPEDVHVYANGPRTADEIRALVETPLHDYLGFNAPGMGKSLNRWETRPNMNGVIAMQSFSSPRWLKDAGEALRRLIRRLEGSPYADRIIGYHVTYGMCGETSIWGAWETDLNRHGDYGVNATKSFIKYARERGAKVNGVPSPVAREVVKEPETEIKELPDVLTAVKDRTLNAMFYDDTACELYSRFLSDTNADAINYFCKIVKKETREKLAGVFYGYIVAIHNSCDAGHLAIDKILDSPYVDFVAGPKGYWRVDPKGPGFPQAVTESINRKKLWIDEVDNRTHLYKANVPDPSAAKDFSETRGVYWREFSKNLMCGQGYWWMDLLGGWLDSEEIREEIKFLAETGAELNKENGASVAEILLVLDDEVMHKLRPSHAFMWYNVTVFCSLVKECGAPVRLYRRSDLSDADLSQYKAVIFLNAFSETPETLAPILAKLQRGASVIFDFAAGAAKNGCVSLENVTALTGFGIGQIADDVPVPEIEQRNLPFLFVKEVDGVKALKRYSTGNIMVAERLNGGLRYVYNALPMALCVEDIRAVLEGAGVHFYMPPHTTVNADSRFVYVISAEDRNCAVKLKEKHTCKNLFTGEVFVNADEIPINIKAGNGAFIKFV